jgi:hypothetical protein
MKRVLAIPERDAVAVSTRGADGIDHGVAELGEQLDPVLGPLFVDVMEARPDAELQPEKRTHGASDASERTKSFRRGLRQVLATSSENGEIESAVEREKLDRAGRAMNRCKAVSPASRWRTQSPSTPR